MIDLHTHILPSMDDGAASPAQSLAMLREQARQGIEVVALTPHFYCLKESADAFLERRAAAWQVLQDAMAELPEAERKALPQLILGAEVAYVPGMWEWPEISELCYENTKVLLLELPTGHWDEEMFRQIYSFISRTGITPVIAHAERYLWHKQFWRLAEMQLPMQVSASALLRVRGRKDAYRLLEEHNGLLISDCHDMLFRSPNLGKAMDWLRRKKGEQAARQCAANVYRALNTDL